MNKRLVLAGTALVLMGALFIPSAAAQIPSKIHFSIAYGHDLMEVPVGGRADMAITVRGRVSDYFCVNEQKINVPLLFQEDFAKWAGASIEPKNIVLKIPAGDHLNGKSDTPETTASVLNLAWDVESVPRTGAVQDYHVVIPLNDVKADQSQGQGPCMEDFAQWDKTSEPPAIMRAFMPDRKEQNATEVEVDCNMDPFQPKCQALAKSVEPESSPGFDVAIFLIAFAGLVALVRRRIH